MKLFFLCSTKTPGSGIAIRFRGSDASGSIKLFFSLMEFSVAIMIFNFHTYRKCGKVGNARASGGGEMGAGRNSKSGSHRHKNVLWIRFCGAWSAHSFAALDPDFLPSLCSPECAHVEGEIPLIPHFFGEEKFMNFRPHIHTPPSKRIVGEKRVPAMAINQPFICYINTYKRTFQPHHVQTFLCSFSGTALGNYSITSKPKMISAAAFRMRKCLRHNNGEEIRFYLAIKLFFLSSTRNSTWSFIVPRGGQFVTRQLTGT